MPIELSRTADESIKLGEQASFTVVFRDKDGNAYTPSTTPTCKRTNWDGTQTDVTFTYSGTAAGGYTVKDAPTQVGFAVYEWRGADSSKPTEIGERIYEVRKTHATF